ncbi:hypothetical protein AWRI1631_41000 [Saccharomyces cerevisiae AWRI1631]|uniref:Uncharacterized protein n=1 Tax=Saccharomyces cerevisiae (strain AWRI1631) TaxID=545124 RepID=B5VFD2_YEAS6|nr:hypothetical protein AWRI1631_41000 [Saccharomyces cerevisiae AWRI1631]
MSLSTLVYFVLLSFVLLLAVSVLICPLSSTISPVFRSTRSPCSSIDSYLLMMLDHTFLMFSSASLWRSMTSSSVSLGMMWFSLDIIYTWPFLSAIGREIPSSFFVFRFSIFGGYTR